MLGENQRENDLFFVCSFIEYVSRKTKNTKKVIVEKLGKENIKKIYELAEVYHSEDIEQVADEFIKSCDIQLGNYDHISNCIYRIPTHWEIGKVYKRLIVMVNDNEADFVETLMEVISSWIIERIDNYNSSMYYENSDYIFGCYKIGKIL